MKIYLGTDHAGFELKEKLKHFLIELGHEVEDLGAFTFNKDDDYPDITTEVSNKTSVNEGSFGIIIGGSGQGEAMVANRKSGIRCVVFYGGVAPKIEVDIEGRKSDNNFEILKLSRMHNNANMLSISARFVSEDEAKEAVKIWLETPFSAEERHTRRIAKF